MDLDSSARADWRRWALELHTWVIGNEDGSGPQGGVTIGDDGEGGTGISLTLGFSGG